MKRPPLIATLVVLAAVATMIWLGIWQLQRRDKKEALIALYRANLGKPAVTFPILPPVPPTALFRPSSVMCLEVGGWQVEGGRAADGGTGYRHIARCRTGAEGPGALVDMGIAADPKFKPVWAGGLVAGRITTAPEHESMLARLFEKAPPPAPMLIALQPAPGLKASAQPSPEGIPNNHLAYSVQWFFFAATATIIYLLALRRRRQPKS